MSPTLNRWGVPRVLKLSSNLSDAFPKVLKLSSEVSECKPLARSFLLYIFRLE
jgi:hypothetical protein